MLMTFPTKASLLRNLNERRADEVFLIVANYKALKNWNLIPLRSLSLFLGPNSAGKSTVFDVIQIIKDFDLVRHEGFLDDWLPNEDIRSSQTSVIGFSMPYILDGHLGSSGLNEIYSNAGAMACGGRRVGYNESFWREAPLSFFIVEGMERDGILYDRINSVRYTMVCNAVSGIEVYFDGELSASREQLYYNATTIDERGVEVCSERSFEGSPSECDFVFHKSAIDLLYKPYVEHRNKYGGNTDIYMPNDPPGEYYGCDGDIDKNGGFVEGRIQNLYNTVWSLKLTEFPEFIYHANSAHEFGSPQAAVGIFLAAYHVPYLRFMDYISGRSSGDIRSITSDWVEMNNDRWSAAHALIQSRIDSIRDSLKLRRGQPVKNIGSAKINVLENVNRWIRDPGFLNSEYKIEVEMIVSIPTDCFDNEGYLSGSEADFMSYCEKPGIPGYGSGVKGRVLLIDKDGRNLKFSDVGAGFTQILPILTGLLDRSLILFKQPELHLHPRLQSRVADCFVETISTEKKVNKARIRMVETHSEHFILRLLRRLRESSFDDHYHSILPLFPHDIAFVYFQPTNEGTLIHQIEVLASGEFVEGWPDGFFDDRDEDLWGQTSPRGR